MNENIIAPFEYSYSVILRDFEITNKYTIKSFEEDILANRVCIINNNYIIKSVASNFAYEKNNKSYKNLLIHPVKTNFLEPYI